MEGDIVSMDAGISGGRPPQRRRLRDLSAVERDRVVQSIQTQAEAMRWHVLDSSQRSHLYSQWEDEHGLTHAAIKDGVMKGFDAAQHIPPSGEAAVHATLRAVLEESPIPYVRSKERRKEWRREVDFVLGFSAHFLTHIAELEPAPSWQQGLQQALLYKSLYYQATQVQALPTLILFGDVTLGRWEQIGTVCADQRVLLLPFDLLIGGEKPTPDIIRTLESNRSDVTIAQTAG
jgi:hypothetical protein